MTYFFKHLLRVFPLTVGAISMVAGAEIAGEVYPAIATPQTQNDSASIPEVANSMAQVTSVSQLSDVQPTDWAFQALQSLVERYGCIAGYPDVTYRGNRPLTRYEFAAGLNACMDRIGELISSTTANLATKADLETVKKLQEEFANELATLKGRVDAVEARTSVLEAQQFSTTTKLSGEAVFAVAAAANAGGTKNQAVFQNRIRLDFQSSFTGKDLLHTRLAAGNAPTFALPPNPGSFGVASSENTLTFQGAEGNAVGIDWLAYQFPIGKKLQIYIAAVGGANTDYLATTANDPLDQADDASGTLSFFAAHNAIYNIGGGSGAGVNFTFNDFLQLSFGYLAGAGTDPASPLTGNGLFNGDYAAFGQLTVTPTQKLTLALTYANSYHSPGTPIFNYGGGSGVVGTSFANFPGGTDAAVSANSYGLSASYRFSSKFVVSAWGGYTDANIKTAGVDNGEIWNYALTFAFPDLLKKGSLGGLIVGVQPYLGNARQLGFSGADNQLPLHVEAFYQYRVNDFISVTPGIIYLNALDQQDSKKAVLGVLRTTFTF
jgi:hypothetical protein